MKTILLEFAMFPTDKGASVSAYVSRVIDMIRQSGHPYRLTPMGTVVETTTMADATALLNQAEEILSADAERVYCSAKFDIRKGKTGRLESKIQSVEKKIGNVKT